MVRLKIDVMPSWSEILRSVEANPNRDKQIEHLAAIRFDYLERLAQKTGRNVITYYSAFLQKSNVPDIAINDKDINAIYRFKSINEAIMYSKKI